MADFKNAPSPCKSCTTVKNPIDCESKNCKRWQQWFVEQWNYWTTLLRQQLKERDGENEQES